MALTDIDGQRLGDSVADKLGDRNLIINGAMTVAQRGTSSTSSGCNTVDRFKGNFNGGAVTQSQGTLTTAAGDAAVYDLGFRHYFRQTNTTTSTGASDHRNMHYRPEAQDLATSGWNYTNSASYVTLSFWVRSSVAQEFYGYIRTENGTQRIYTFSTGTLVADEWTKIEKTIPGDSSLEIPNDNTSGPLIFIGNPFWGTDFTDASVTLDTWRNYDTTLRTPPYTDTWAATTNATLDITGVQLEVGNTATPFQHESYGQTLAKCQRYYQILRRNPGVLGMRVGVGQAINSNQVEIVIPFSTTMREAPTALEQSGTASDYGLISATGSGGDCTSVPTFRFASINGIMVRFTDTGHVAAGNASQGYLDQSEAFLAWSAEL